MCVVRNVCCDSEQNNRIQHELFVFLQKLKKTANISEYEAIALTSTPRSSALFIELSVLLDVDSGELSGYSDQVIGCTTEKSCFDSPRVQQSPLISKVFTRPVVGSTQPPIG